METKETRNTNLTRTNKKTSKFNSQISSHGPVSCFSFLEKKKNHLYLILWMFLICLLILFKTQSQAEPLLFECYNTINMYEYGFFFLSHFHLLHWKFRPFHFKISSNIRHAHAHNHMYECKSSRSSLSKSFIVCIELWSENINGFFHIDRIFYQILLLLLEWTKTKSGP